MKREFAFLFIVLLFVNLTIAANQSANLSDLKGVANVSEFSDVKGKTNQFLEKEVKIPENFQIATRILFGLKQDEKIDFQRFVILIALWMGVFLFLHEIIKFIPFFQGPKSWIFSVLIMLLIGISNGLQIAVQFLFDLSNFFGVLEEWSLLRVALTILIILSVLFVFSYVTRKLYRAKEKETMHLIGSNIRVANEMGKVMKESFDKESKADENIKKYGTRYG